MHTRAHTHTHTHTQGGGDGGDKDWMDNARLERLPTIQANIIGLFFAYDSSFLHIIGLFFAYDRSFFSLLALIAFLPSKLSYYYRSLKKRGKKGEKNHAWTVFPWIALTETLDLNPRPKP